MRRLVVLFVSVCLCSTLGLLASAARAQAAESPVIGGFGIEYAPKGKNGKILLPWMWCEGSGSNKATMTNTKTGKVINRTWSFGMSHVSVPAGTYRVTIRATCNGAASSYTATRTIKRESDKNTVTKAEFKKIKKGMRLKKVQKIVGNKGLDFGSTRLLDRRGDFGWAELTIERGKVVDKWWDTPLGDSYVR